MENRIFKRKFKVVTEIEVDAIFCVKDSKISIQDYDLAFNPKQIMDSMEIERNQVEVQELTAENSQTSGISNGDLKIRIKIH